MGRSTRLDKALHPIWSTACLLTLLSSCGDPGRSGGWSERTGADSLITAIAALDSALFAAFNAHDADRLGTFFTPDLEFYHDRGGLGGFDSTLAGFRRLFSQAATADMQRELVPGTLEVYRLGEFGLLEICRHRFCHTENGTRECGTFKNVMVWRKEGDRYKVSRVISFDH
ncbi:MAG TPA: nuclear transport factor 2 family protein [Flavobacteriales bacterium]|nr:nuclear transport factor 2 family protein [Flavobacteriales bacterium]HMR28874.1 nuclear transport factor 2 family protein [Flavobacteriales bacterium]